MSIDLQHANDKIKVEAPGLTFSTSKEN